MNQQNGLFTIQRLGTVMVADPANPAEAWGVLNPATCRDRAGTRLLFPRIVAKGNYSRVGLARIDWRDDKPVGVTRLGVALEPEEGWERNPTTAGVEDPRITFLPALNCYVMAYAAYGPLGPRAALATSQDGYTWHRVGPIHFEYDHNLRADLNLYANKDAMLFPEPVRDPHGRLSLALLHRPDYNVTWWKDPPFVVQPAGVAEPRPSIWISYAPLDDVLADSTKLALWRHHQPLAFPEQSWEGLKIGGGTPPLLTHLGWLTLFHGVEGYIVPGVDHQRHVRYTAGILVLDRHDPRKILYRSPDPIMVPETIDEQQGIVSNVVFPTAVDPHGPREVDIYYGMADARIGAARLTLPDTLPT
ncbi:MAG: hypothetical protein NVS4B8_01750 [Herpetosiphon sp.]